MKMFSLLFATLMLGSAFGWQGGWNPEYCCYPPPEVCCPTIRTTTTTEPTTTSFVCPLCLDVAFVVDISSSIGNVRLQTIINPFLQMFAESSDWEIGTGTNQVQASMTTFANDATLKWNWMSPETANSGALSAAIATLTTTQFQGLTNTPAGLNVTRTQVIEGPGNRPECPDVGFVLTDGAANLNLDIFPDQAQQFKDALDLSVVVGITSNVEPEQLEQLGTQLDDIIYVDEFDQLAGFFDEIYAMISCPGGSSDGGSGRRKRDAHEATTMPPTESTWPCCPYDYPYYYDLMHKKDKW